MTRLIHTLLAITILCAATGCPPKPPPDEEFPVNGSQPAQLPLDGTR